MERTMKILMKPRSSACATRVLEVSDHHLSEHLGFYGWWRPGEELGFCLSFQHLIDHYDFIYSWNGDKIRNIRHEILEAHHRREDPGVLSTDCFTGGVSGRHLDDDF